MAGVFISLEGIDGSGKSTLARKLAEYLSTKSVEVVSVREPGSTALAESVREILLTPESEICGRAELMLYEAARAQLTNEVIQPALSRGAVVVADRFGDSSVAYQGYGRGLGPETVRMANAVATNGLFPDITSSWTSRFRWDFRDGERTRTGSSRRVPSSIRTSARGSCPSRATNRNGLSSSTERNRSKRCSHKHAICFWRGGR